MDKFETFPSEENETARLFNELLPWTYNCRTLIDAARHGRTIECEHLIRQGVDVNECDHYGNTPLWTSYFHAHLETLFTLLQVEKLFVNRARERCVHLSSSVRIRILDRVMFYVRIFIEHVSMVIEH